MDWSSFFLSIQNLRSNKLYPYDTCGISLSEDCQLIHLHNPLKEEVHPAEVHPWVTKQRLESIMHPFRFCRPTTLLVVSLEKNPMGFHILLLNEPGDFLLTLSLLMALLCVISISRTGISRVYLSSLFYEFPLNVSSFVETHLIEW